MTAVGSASGTTTAPGTSGLSPHIDPVDVNAGVVTTLTFAMTAGPASSRIPCCHMLEGVEAVVCRKVSKYRSEDPICSKEVALGDSASRNKSSATGAVSGALKEAS